MLERIWRKGNSLALLVGMQIDRATMETVWRFLKKTRNKTSYDPTMPLLNINSEETVTEKDTCTPMFTAILFTTRTGILVEYKNSWYDIFSELVFLPNQEYNIFDYTMFLIQILCGKFLPDLKNNKISASRDMVTCFILLIPKSFCFSLSHGCCKV